MKNNNVVVFDQHALIQHHLAILRNRRTKQQEFNQSLHIVTLMMAAEITRALPSRRTTIRTPLEDAEVKILSGRPPVVVGILRAGFGMVDPLRAVLPDSPVGHISMSRDHKTLRPKVEMVKLPNVTGRFVILAETMLATGGSASKGLHILQEKGAREMVVVGLVAAPEGIEAIQCAHPGVKIYTAAIDRCLNNKGYILPGLGDAGDRIFGTML